MMTPPLRVLGIDPGSRNLGFAVVEKQGNRMHALAQGTVKLDVDLEIHDRLPDIHFSVQELILKFQPRHLAIEKVFFAKNALSALKLGQARGVILLAAAQARLGIFEYSPNEVKQALTGHGHADKEQIQKMAGLLIGVREFKTFDASDAVAIAICHLNSYSFRERVAQK